MRISLICSTLLIVGLSSQGAMAASEWDIDADGTITWAEVEEMRKRIFETFDSDQNGVLDSAEYTAFDKARAEAAEKDPTSLALRAVSGLARENTDLNLDGQVTRTELETALRTWFDRIDTNGNGVITKGEY